MRRYLAAVLLAVATVMLSGGAEAGVTYDLVFRTQGASATPVDINGNVILDASVDPANRAEFTFGSGAAASACDPFTGDGCPAMDVLLKTTEAHAGSFVNVGFDTDSGLQVARASQWRGVTILDMRGRPVLEYRNGIFEIDNARGTIVEFGGFAVRAPQRLQPGIYHIGTIVWDTARLRPPSSNAISGFVYPISTIVYRPPDSDNWVDITRSVALASGFIDVVPEPATAALMGLGLLGIALGRRRRLRS